jgi:hypothetical protein
MLFLLSLGIGQSCPCDVQLTLRMSHEEERGKGIRIPNKAKRAPPHWLNPLVGLFRSCSLPTKNWYTPSGG